MRTSWHRKYNSSLSIVLRHFRTIISLIQVLISESNDLWLIDLLMLFMEKTEKTYFPFSPFHSILHVDNRFGSE
jgi:hypothetical protein